LRPGQDAFAETGSHGAIKCVENGIELLEYLYRCGSLPALILLDLNMPRKDGRQALREIKSIRAFQDIPVVVLTTSQEEKDRVYTRRMGANSFITKPSSFSEWVRMMKELRDAWLAFK